MAYKITDFTRSVAAGGSYPYGDVKDDPSGTLVNRLAMNDVWQFFQRIMADTAITPLSTPDNLANGYQLVQALNTLYCRRFNGQAAAAGSPTGTYIPVIMSGLVNSGTYPAYNVSPGFFFYNGQYVFCPGGSGVIPPVTTLLLNISTSDAQPIANITTGHPPVPGPGGCALSIAVPWSTAVGIDSLNTDVVALQTVTAFGTWTNLPALTSPWISGGVSNYKKDGSGKVNFGGSITYNSTGTPSGIICTMPVGFRPTTDQVFLLNGQNGTGGYMGVSVSVETTGVITMLNVPTPGGSIFYVDLVQIQYYTT